MGTQMWPFHKKPRLPGIKRDHEGGLSFELTDAEDEEVKAMFVSFKDYRVHSTVAEKLKLGITARGLANYAFAQARTAENVTQKVLREECIQNAIARSEERRVGKECR